MNKHFWQTGFILLTLMTLMSCAVVETAIPTGASHIEGLADELEGDLVLDGLFDADATPPERHAELFPAYGR